MWFIYWDLQGKWGFILMGTAGAAACIAVLNACQGQLEQEDMRWMRGGCRMHAGWMWDGRKVDAGWIWGGYGVDVGWMWGGYGVDMGWLWDGCSPAAGLVQAACRGAAGPRQRAGRLSAPLCRGAGRAGRTKGDILRGGISMNGVLRNAMLGTRLSSLPRN